LGQDSREVQRQRDLDAKAERVLRYIPERKLIFHSDQDARHYFAHIMHFKKKTDNYTVPKQHHRLLSFSARDKHITFDNVFEVAKKTGSTYIDAKVLPTMPGSYCLPNDLNNVRNMYWQEYY